jgi:hypothetical protein
MAQQLQRLKEQEIWFRPPRRTNAAASSFLRRGRKRFFTGKKFHRFVGPECRLYLRPLEAGLA